MAERTRKKDLSKGEISDVLYGKLPPSAPEIETAVIGALLIDSSCGVVIDDLEADLFYSNENRLVMAAIKELWVAGEREIDILTVTAKMKAQGTLEAAGGYYGVTKISGAVGSTAHIDRHIGILREKYLRRRLIQAGIALASNAYGDEVDVDELLKSVDDLMSSSKDVTRSISKFRSMEEIIKAMFKTGGTSTENPLAIGYPDIDRYECSTPGELTVVSGRPGMGKTAYALWEARKTAEQGYPVGFFSLEMKVLAWCQQDVIW